LAFAALTNEWLQLQREVVSALLPPYLAANQANTQVMGSQGKDRLLHSRQSKQQGNHIYTCFLLCLCGAQGYSLLMYAFKLGHDNVTSVQVVLHRLWAVNPHLLLEALIEFYAQDANNLPRVLDICQELRVRRCQPGVASGCFVANILAGIWDASLPI
jgi:hypothetical protein